VSAFWVKNNPSRKEREKKNGKMYGGADMSNNITILGEQAI
jgi:hypothetical protein